MRHVNSFLNLKCAPDILATVSPVNNLSKEISEVHVMLQAMKKLIPPNECHKYQVLDLCAGNGLLGVTLAHLFNYDFVTSFDLRRPERDFRRVRDYWYTEMDITEAKQTHLKGKVIVANHPCKLAANIVDAFCKYDAKALVLMPCCQGKLKPRPQFITKKLGKYGAWCADLYDTIIYHSIRNNENIKVSMREYTSCLSPKNVIITAIRE